MNHATNNQTADAATVFDFRARNNQGEVVDLAQFAGHVLLIVNTASRCGFTPQYAGLQALYDAYRSRGFEVLAFPCNQFGQQEPGDDRAIAQFCASNYQTTFPLFAKIDVNGANAQPLFAFLKAQAPGILGTKRIKWNFTKFLVGRDGHVRRRFAPADTPESLLSELEAALQADTPARRRPG